jgi:acyl carrier protein
MATFDKNDTASKIIAGIAQELKLDKNTITPHATFQDLGADSLDMVQLVMRFEEQFGIEINDDDAQNLHNVEQVIDYIHSKRTQ